MSTPRSDIRLLGLTVGQRALLAAAYGGVTRVVWLGDGPRPQDTSGRTEFVDLDAARADGRAGDGVFVLPADLVYDRGLLGDPAALPDDLPIRWLAGDDLDLLDTIASDSQAWIDGLGSGRADGGRGFAIRVVDPATRRRAHRALMLSLRKPIDGFVSRHLNRYVSGFLSGLLARTGVSPNVLTVLFLFIGLAGGWFASWGEPWWALVAAGFLFQAQSILDGCDGEIARLTYRFSHIGQWMDSVGDDLTNYCFCLGLALGQSRVREASWLYVAGFAIFGLQILVSGVCYRRLVILGTGDLLAIPDLTTTAATGAWGRFVEAARIVTKRDVFVFVIAVLTAVQLPLVAWVLYAGGTIPTAIGVILNDIKISRLNRADAG